MCADHRHHFVSDFTNSARFGDGSGECVLSLVNITVAMPRLFNLTTADLLFVLIVALEVVSLFISYNLRTALSQSCSASSASAISSSAIASCTAFSSSVILSRA